MSLKLGSSGLMVDAWVATMKKRFASYAKGVDGQPIRIDGKFGYDEEKVQKEYQLRTGQVGPGKPASGQVSDRDLYALGLLPTLLTIHGTGQADPFGIGYPADIARRCLDLYWWQPIGNYPAKAVPMNGSADAGEREAALQVSRAPGPVAFVDYSQGSICGGRVRNRMRKGEFPGKTLIGSASFGNPMRPAGSYAGNVDPGGEGIDPTLESATEPGVINLAARGDIYTSVPDNGVGEMERAIFNLVFSRWIGTDSIVEQLWEMFTNPVFELANAAIAAWNGGLFVARGTGPHVRYHIDQCPGTGMTYYEYAVKHMRDLANTRLERIASSA
jgi:hypothetical protein